MVFLRLVNFSVPTERLCNLAIANADVKVLRVKTSK